MTGGAGFNPGASAGLALFLRGGNLNLTVNSGSQTLDGSIADAAGENPANAGSLTKRGAGTLVLNGDSAGPYGYAGGTTLQAGAVSVAGDASLGKASGALNFNGGGFDIADAANNFTVNQTLAGGSLSKLGAGTLTLGTANTYGGGTSIHAGTLSAGDNHALGSGTVGIGAGATLHVQNGVTLANPINLVGGALSGGGGISSALNIDQGDNISPGNSPGTFSGTHMALGPGGTYTFEVRDFGGTAGIDWDLLSLSGTLDITATLLDRFTIDLVSLDALDAPGTAAHFDATQSHRLILAKAIQITNFNVARFDINASAFLNDTQGGTWRLSTSEDNSIPDLYNLNLDFTPATLSGVPEPGTLALFGFGAALLRRRG